MTECHKKGGEISTPRTDAIMGYVFMAATAHKLGSEDYMFWKEHIEADVSAMERELADANRRLSEAVAATKAAEDREREITEAHLILGERLSEATARIATLETRLEVHPEAPAYDGISCRDETIRLQDERIESLCTYAEHSAKALVKAREILGHFQGEIEEGRNDGGSLGPKRPLSYESMALVASDLIASALAELDAALAQNPAGAVPANSGRDTSEAEGPGHAPASAGPACSVCDAADGEFL